MTKVTKFFAVFALLTVLVMPQVSAFTFLGIDFGKVWDKVTFWNNDEETALSVDDLNTNFVINLGGVNVSSLAVVEAVNQNEDIKGYIKGFGYECLYVNTDNNLNATAFLDVEKGEVKALAKGKYCDDEIFFEESLLEDLKDGFDKGKIKDYMSKVNLPAGMYLKAVKVFGFN